MTKAEQLIQDILAESSGADEGVLANELLREFHRGFPVEQLRPLLLSDDNRIVGTARFIVDELGGKAAPLLDVMVTLLHHTDKHVRCDAIGSILTCATENNKSHIAIVVSLRSDPEWPIRWKTMELLSLASMEQLTAALQHFETYTPDSDHILGLRWLTSVGGRNLNDISLWLRNHNLLQRKYGVITAARIVQFTNEYLCRHL